MFWTRVSTISYELFRPLKTYLHHHSLAAFRTLLLTGVMLLIATLWYTHSTFLYQPHYYLWLAGLSATLGILFLFTVVSVSLYGYHYMRDIWLTLAITTIFGLSATLALAALCHAP
jgi:hypothetical protein